MKVHTKASVQSHLKTVKSQKDIQKQISKTLKAHMQKTNFRSIQYIELPEPYDKWC